MSLRFSFFWGVDILLKAASSYRNQYHYICHYAFLPLKVIARLAWPGLLSFDKNGDDQFDVVDQYDIASLR
jgi:hypothetical protein